MINVLHYSQLQSLGAQNALWQSQLTSTAAPPMNLFNNTTTTTTANSGPNLNGFAPSDLHALQMALQQQQQNLQQQLQNFLLFQQPSNVQTSAILLQTQISQAVAQATNQLRLLQRHQSTANQETPKTKSEFKAVPSLPNPTANHFFKSNLVRPAPFSFTSPIQGKSKS